MSDVPVALFAPKGAKQHAEPILKRLGDSICEIRMDWNPEIALAGSPKLLVVFDEHGAEIGFLVQEARRRGIATLQVMDGILEWRRTWEYPTTEYKRPLNQPSYADRIACLGYVDQRLLSAWGNAGRCIAIGAPRMDALTESYAGMRKTIDKSKQRILVMSAKTPYFNEEQKIKVIKAMSDLKSMLLDFDGIEVVWRISAELAGMLDVQTNMSGVLTGGLVDVLREVDMVITTPSTSMLEAMLCGIPTAVVDYTNGPSYVQSAWRITSKEHILDCIEQMSNPSPAKVLHQHYCLSDALNINPDATGRMVDLIMEMLEMQKCHLLPSKNISGKDSCVAYGLPRRTEVYPYREIFKIDDVGILQDQLDAALAVNNMLCNRLAHIENRLNSIPGIRLIRRLVNRARQK